MLKLKNVKNLPCENDHEFIIDNVKYCFEHYPDDKLKEKRNANIVILKKIQNGIVQTVMKLKIKKNEVLLDICVKL